MKLFSYFDILIIIFVGFCAFFPLFITNQSKNAFIISTDKQKIEIPLTADTVLLLNDTEIQVKNGAAKIIASSCANQICVLQGALHQNGQIVCVPNKIIVSLNIITNKTAPKVDVYAE